MTTKIHPAPALGGNYDLRRLDSAQLGGAETVHVGLVRIGVGTRSPVEGLRASARHEIAYIVEGTARVDTAAGTRTVNAHDVIVSSPAEEHSTTALTDTTIFFVLIDPLTGV
jgi:quercetin dioxygenase-like cupin family protein